MTKTRSVALGLGLALLPAAVRADDWPGFRGQGGCGVSAETGLPARWGAEENVAWKAKVPGYGWSSPVVWGDKVFVTTAVSDKQAKPGGFGGGFPGGGFPPRGGRRGSGGFPGGRGTGGRAPAAVYRWEVYCLNKADGKVLWQQVAREARPAVGVNSFNTYATETPVTDGERLYAYFGNTGVFCYDLAGKLLWKKGLGAYRMQLGHGTGSSPALGGERLFIQCDNEEKSFLVALDKKTGKELWRVDRPERSTWSTPLVWKAKGRTEVVCGGARKVRSYDPATGKQLWELGGMTAACQASPVADAERLYFGTSLRPSGAGPLYAVKAGAAGDITLKEGEESNAGVAWVRARSGPALASPLLYQGYLYVLEQRGGFLSCYGAKTGQPAYSKQRLPGGRGFTASPWAYEGKVFCLADDGKAFVVRAGPEYKLLGTNALNGETCWATPAVAGGALILRSVDYLYCLKK